MNGTSSFPNDDTGTSSNQSTSEEVKPTPDTDSSLSTSSSSDTSSQDFGRSRRCSNCAGTGKVQTFITKQSEFTGKEVPCELVPVACNYCAGKGYFSVTDHTYELHKLQLAANTYLDNILIRQKDTLISRIDNASSVDDLRAALYILNVLGELWRTANYGYKVSELRDRIDKKRATFRS